MMLRDIKSIHDVILAYHKKQKLMDKEGKYYSIVSVEEEKTESGYNYYITLERGNSKFPLLLENVVNNFRIVILSDKNKNMEDFVKRMIVEHKELCERIGKLHAWVFGDQVHTVVDAIEYANECIQLRAMKIYEEALRARLHNQGIEVDGDNYYATIKVEDEEESAIDND